MKIPSTSDLTHAQANTAYDRLAVISDHMPMLHEVCEFILDLKEWIRANQHFFLQEFIAEMNSNLTTVETALNNLALIHSNDIASITESLATLNSSISNINSQITQLNTDINSVLIHTLDATNDTKGATCKAIAAYVAEKLSVLTGSLDNQGTSLSDILVRLSNLETRVTNLESSSGTEEPDFYKPRIKAYYVAQIGTNTPEVGNVYNSNVLATSSDSTSGVSRPSNLNTWVCIKAKTCTATVSSSNGHTYVTDGEMSIFEWYEWVDEEESN